MWPFKKKEEVQVVIEPAPCGEDVGHHHWTKLNGLPCPYCSADYSRRRKEEDENRLAQKIAKSVRQQELEATLDEMVNRFLWWKLPKDFSPDAGISFTPTKPYEGDEFGNSWWPVGTNLLTAEQARAMFKACLSLEPSRTEETKPPEASQTKRNNCNNCNNCNCNK